MCQRLWHHGHLASIKLLHHQWMLLQRDSARGMTDPRCRFTSDIVSQQMTSPADKARLLAVTAPGSSAWLEVMHLAAVSLKLDDASLRVAAGLRLGAPVVFSLDCCCGESVSSDGRHGRSCRKSAGRQSRHGQLNDIMFRAFQSIGVMTIREPIGLSRSNGKRPDGVTVVPWRRGRNLAWDVTCADTFAASHLKERASVRGQRQTWRK